MRSRASTVRRPGRWSSVTAQNIHLGRFEHPDVYPAHSVPLIHYRLNFPLSTYFAGANTIRSHPKYGRFERARPPNSPGSRRGFEGEEDVNGQRCLRIRVDRWYYSKDLPVLQHLWLCPSRNYQCLKETLSWPGSMFGGLPLMRCGLKTSEKSRPASGSRRR